MSDSEEDEYEALRRHNLARKKAVLAELGVDSLINDGKKLLTQTQQSPEKSYRSAARKRNDAIPARRSARIQKKVYKVKYVRGFRGFVSDSDIKVLSGVDDTTDMKSEGLSINGDSTTISQEVDASFSLRGKTITNDSSEIKTPPPKNGNIELHEELNGKCETNRCKLECSCNIETVVSQDDKVSEVMCNDSTADCKYASSISLFVKGCGNKDKSFKIEHNDNTSNFRGGSVIAESTMKYKDVNKTFELTSTDNAVNLRDVSTVPKFAKESGNEEKSSKVVYNHNTIDCKDVCGNVSAEKYNDTDKSSKGNLYDNTVDLKDGSDTANSVVEQQDENLGGVICKNNTIDVVKLAKKCGDYDKYSEKNSLNSYETASKNYVVPRKDSYTVLRNKDLISISENVESVETGENSTYYGKGDEFVRGERALQCAYIDGKNLQVSPENIQLVPWYKRDESACLKVIKENLKKSALLKDVCSDDSDESDDDWSKYKNILFCVSTSEASEDDSDAEVGQQRSRTHVQRVGYSNGVPSISPDEVTEEMISNIAKRSSQKVYNQLIGTTCHQCRQKTFDTKTVCRSGRCIGVRGMFCGICLPKRYGEKVVDALKNPKWECPVCRGICNCSFCRARAGKDPTGIMYPQARLQGYMSVAEYLKDNDDKENGKKKEKVKKLKVLASNEKE